MELVPEARPEDDLAQEVLFQGLVDFARSAIRSYRIPGTAIGLWYHNREYSAGVGVTSLEDPLPVTPGTLFQAGSITKTFTAMRLLQLVDQGKVNLEDRVRQFIPDFRVRDEKTSELAKVRHLLNHTAGWRGDLCKNTGDGGDALAKFVEAMADLPQLAPIGSCYAYNNASYDVAGRIVEIAGGLPYETAIRESILDPLEMDHSFFFPAQVMDYRFAACHIMDGNEVRVSRPWAMHRGENPDGGLVTNVHDLIKYARFHMGNGQTLQGERLLTKGSIERMQSPSVEVGNGIWIGMNWFIQDVGGVRFLRHAGETRGQSAILWLVPEWDLAFAALSNLNQGAPLHRELFDWVCRHYLHLDFPWPDK